MMNSAFNSNWFVLLMFLQLVIRLLVLLLSELYYNTAKCNFASAIQFGSPSYTQITNSNVEESNNNQNI